ncbi:hypothetical protein [Streptomyces sp. NPDC060366]|uniref:hypothetical protein n=1 Tax=Streptomyces sp. NPDC060366 TaxID=3347105 RepID=UPI00366018D4
MFWITVVSATLLITLSVAAVFRLRALGRALAAEKASSRVAEAMRSRDNQALHDRLQAARAQHDVLAAAAREIDRALALYAPNRDPNEGS